MSGDDNIIMKDGSEAEKKAWSSYLEKRGEDYPSTAFHEGWNAAIEYAKKIFKIDCAELKPKLQFWVPLDESLYDDDGTAWGCCGKQLYHSWSVTFGNQIAHHGERYNDDDMYWESVGAPGPTSVFKIDDPEFLLKHKEVNPELCSESDRAFYMSFDFENYSSEILSNS